MRLFVLFGTVTSPLAQWLVFWLLARHGGGQTAGEFAELLAFVTPLSVVTNFGLRNSFVTLRARHPFRVYLNLRLASCLIVAVAVIVLGAVLHLSVSLVYAVAIMKVADNLLDILLAPLQRFGRLGAYGLILTANGIVTVIGASAFATVVAEPNMIVFGSSLGSIVAVVLAVLVLVSPSLRDNKDVGEHEVLGDWHILLKASWSITAGQIFAAAIANLPTWIVSFLGTSEDVARFAGAAYLLTIGSIIGSALNVSFVSEYRLLVARGKLGQLVGRLRRSVLLLIISSGVVMVLGGVAGPKFFELVYGQEFSYSSWFIAGLSLAAVLNVGTHVMNAALLAVNLYNRQLAIVLVSLVCGVSVSFLSYPHIGSALWTGAVAGIVASIAKFLLSVGTVVSISRS